jgi:uncharacterized protein DUF6011
MITTSLPAETIERARSFLARRHGMNKAKRRREDRIYEAADAYRQGNGIGNGTTCYICSRRLTDPPSITRGIGPECWEGVLRLAESAEYRRTTRADLAARHFVEMEARLQEEAKRDPFHGMTKERWIELDRGRTRVDMMEPSMKLADHVTPAVVEAVIGKLEALRQQKGYPRAEKNIIKGVLEMLREGYVPLCHAGSSDVDEILKPIIETYNAARREAWDEAARRSDELRAVTDYEAKYQRWVAGIEANRRHKIRQYQLWQIVMEVEDPVACVDILVRDYADWSDYALKQLTRDDTPLLLELLKRHPAFRKSDAA